MSKIVNVIAKAIVDYAEGRLYNQEQLEQQLSDGLDTCVVKVWREDKTVKLPTYSKNGDACMDVYVRSIEKKDDGRVIYHTGLHFRLPEDYEMEIRPRSSATKTTIIMQNSPGTLDSQYIGELMIVHRTISKPYDSVPEYSIGDRVAQILVRRRERIIWDEVSDKEMLGETNRGDGGFGSTGK